MAHAIRRHAPFLVLLLWLLTIGYLMWSKAYQSLQPPQPDPISYIQKAKQTWENAYKGFPKNPLNVPWSLRPPGTTLISFPLGFDGDHHAFHFRTVFIPFLVWTLAVLMACWPIGGIRKTRDAWKVVWAGIVFGASPFFFNFEANEGSNIVWGYMDQALGAFAGLAMAAIARSSLSRSSTLLLFGICVASFTLLLKPTGSLVILFTGALFCIGELMHTIGNIRHRRPLKMRFAITGLAFFLIIGGGISMLCLMSEYLGKGNITMMSGATKYLKSLESDVSTNGIIRNLYVYFGIPGMLLLGSTAFDIGLEWKKKESRSYWVLLFAVLCITCSIAMFGSNVGVSQTRYNSPFVFMALVLIIYWLFMSENEGSLNFPNSYALKRIWIIAGTASSIGLLTCMAVDNPIKQLQQALSINVDINTSELDGVKVAKWLKARKPPEGRPLTVYPIFLQKEIKDGSEISIVSLNADNRYDDSPNGKTYATAQRKEWQGDPVIYLTELVWDSDFIILNGDTSSWIKDTLKKDGYNFEMRKIRNFLYQLTLNKNLELVKQIGKFWIIKIPDKDLFMANFDSAFANNIWSAAFTKANGISHGKAHIFDTLTRTLAVSHRGKAGNKTEGHIDEVNSLPSAQSPINSGRSLKVKGWLAADARSGILADEIFITLEDSAGIIYFGKTIPLKRPDLALGFKHEKMTDAGFETNLDLKELTGHYKLGIAFVKNDIWYRYPSSNCMVRVRKD